MVWRIVCLKRFQYCLERFNFYLKRRTHAQIFRRHKKLAVPRPLHKFSNALPRLEQNSEFRLHPFNRWLTEYLTKLLLYRVTKKNRTHVIGYKTRIIASNQSKIVQHNAKLMEHSHTKNQTNRLNRTRFTAYLLKSFIFSFT